MTDEIYNGLEHKDQVDWMISFIPQPMVQQSYAARSGGNSLGLQSVTDDQIGKLSIPWKLAYHIQISNDPANMLFS